MSPTLRAPLEEDLPSIVRLASAQSPEPTDEEAVRREWTAPGVDLERDARIEPESFVLVETLDDGRVWIDIRGNPSEAMLDWAEARSRELGGRVFSGVWTSNTTLPSDLEQRGFVRVRHSQRMAIGLDRPLPDPVWPDGVEVRTFAPGDERLFYDLFRETFEDTWEHIEEPYEQWAHWVFHPRALVPDLWFLAVGETEPAGFAICHPHSTSADLGWVRMLGVRRPWRRRGLGRALLLHAFAAFRQRGLGRAGLGVDAESLTGANRLYERVGMHVSARFDIYERKPA